ncbi:hypothetical protein DRP04_12525 [Archaeoglobales archaeon]|nr:MAG: hypothetical protein DRP04_12525 [Archaeoglobales archaeon]
MIVDTSIVIRWFVPGLIHEEYCMAIKKLFEAGKIQLKVPELVVYETCYELNKLLSGPILSKLVSLAVDYLYHIAVRPEPDVFVKALDFFKKGYPLTPSLCLSMSTHSNETYITTDKELVKKAGSFANVKHILDISF